MDVEANVLVKATGPTRAPLTLAEARAVLSSAEAEQARAVAARYDDPNETTERGVLDAGEAVALARGNVDEALRRAERLAQEQAAAAHAMGLTELGGFVRKVNVECPAESRALCEQLLAAICVATAVVPLLKRKAAEAMQARVEAVALAKRLGVPLPPCAHPGVGDWREIMKQLIHAAGDPDAYRVFHHGF